MDRLLALRATTPVVDTLAAILDPINGTVRGLARFRTGAKVKEFAEAPWGDAVADTGIVVRYHFAGREYDSESGLYYMRARYYDPALGRWISEDPIGIAGGLNGYAYAGNDPVNGRDPSGLKLVCTTVELDGYGGGRRECRDVWGPLDWLDPGEQCAMDTFHDPECSGYPDQDVLDYYSGLGGGEGPGAGKGAGPCDAVSHNPAVFAALNSAWQSTFKSGAEEGGALFGHGLGLTGFTGWTSSGLRSQLKIQTPFPVGVFALFHSHPNAGRSGPRSVWLQAPSPRDTALADSLRLQIFVVSRDSFFTYRPGMGTTGCHR